MNTTLDHECRTILVQLEMTSNGSTQSWNPSGGFAGEPDDKVVMLVLHGEEALHDHFRRRFASCRSDRARSAVLAEARDALEHSRKRLTPVEDAPSITFEDAVIEDYVGVAVDIAAARSGLYPARVRRIRIRADRDPETGFRPMAFIANATPADRAAALRDQGLTQVEIAERMGLSQPTVHRLLKFRRVAA